MRDRPVGYWLIGIAGLIFLMVILSDAARVTEYHLSLTEWVFVTGLLPPFSAQAWQTAFARYRDVLHYRNIDQGVTLAAFKSLFYWEYAHQLLSRLMAIAAIVPPVVFLWQRRLPGWRMVRCFAVPVLILAQDLVGWLMIKDGSFLRGDAACYRIAAHLGLAVVTYGYVVWCAADILRREPLWLPSAAIPRFRFAARVILVLVVLSIISGGLRSGLAAHATASLATAQWDHRVLGLLTLGAVLAFWFSGCQKRVCKSVKMPLYGMTAVIALQTLLGISTSYVPAPIIVVAHEAAGFLLFSFALLTLHGLKDIKRKVQPKTA